MEGKDGEKIKLNVRYERARKSSGRGSGTLFQFEFAPVSVTEKAARVRLMYGDSQRWVDFQASRQRPLNLLLGGLTFGLLAIHPSSGFRSTMILAGVAASIVYVWLAHTRAGRHLYALGASRPAARLAGISHRRTWLAAFAGGGLSAL